MPDDAPVVLERFTHLIDAELSKSVLEGSGIRCELLNAHVVGVLPHLSNAVGGVELRVRAADADLARRLLAEQSEPAEGEAAPAPDEAPLQPSARDTQATRAFRSAVLALFLLLPVVLNAYSVWLLLTLERAPGELSARGRRHVVLAVVFNLLLGWIPAALLLSGR